MAIGSEVPVTQSNVAAPAVKSISPPSKIEFTKPALKKTMAQWDRIGSQGVINDTRVAGLRVRRQATHWSAEINKRIRGKVYRRTLMQIRHADDVNVNEMRLAAQAVIADLASGRDQGLQEKLDAQAEKLNRMTLKEAIDHHFAVRDEPARQSTITQYHQAANAFCPSMLKTPMGSITRHDISDCYRKTLDRGVSRSTADSYGRMVKAVFSTWVHGFEPESRPVNAALEGLKSPSGKSVLKKPKPKTGRLQRSEFPQWFDAIASVRCDVNLHAQAALDAIQMITLTGMRANEAFGLRWDEVDAVFDGVFTLQPERHKTGAKTGVFHKPYGSHVKALLDRRRALRYEDCPYVFESWMKPGTPIKEVRKTLKHVNDHAGVKVAIHDLRRTYEDVSETAQVSGFIQRKLTNHSTADSVHENYKGGIEDEMIRDLLMQGAQTIEDEIARLGALS